MPPQLPHCTAQSNNSKQRTTENECTNGDSGAAATGWVCVVLGTQPLIQSKVNVLKEITGVPHILTEQVIRLSSPHSDHHRHSQGGRKGCLEAQEHLPFVPLST